MGHDNTARSERLLRLPDVRSRTGLSRTTIYAYISAGDFPKGIRLGARCVAWAESEIDRWISLKIAHRQAVVSKGGNRHEL